MNDWNLECNVKTILILLDWAMLLAMSLPSFPEGGNKRQETRLLVAFLPFPSSFSPSVLCVPPKTVWSMELRQPPYSPSSDARQYLFPAFRVTRQPLIREGATTLFTASDDDSIKKGPLNINGIGTKAAISTPARFYRPSNPTKGQPWTTRKTSQGGAAPSLPLPALFYLPPSLSSSIYSSLLKRTLPRQEPTDHLLTG